MNQESFKKAAQKHNYEDDALDAFCDDTEAMGREDFTYSQPKPAQIKSRPNIPSGRNAKMPPMPGNKQKGDKLVGFGGGTHGQRKYK